MLDPHIHSLHSETDIVLLTEIGQSLSIDKACFDVRALQTKGLITQEMLGRGKVYFFSLPQLMSSTAVSQTQYALRHYRRGGLIAKLSSDQFIYTSLKQTRCYQELSMLDFLKRHQLNVPAPIAAKVTRSGIFYRADIITEVVPQANELHQILQTQPIADETWHEIGLQIKRMHKLNVCHYDINVKNILLQSNNATTTVYLIDFDKCAIKKDGEWKAQNLARLHRSLQKQQGLLSNQHKPYHFTPENWQTLLLAYAL